MESSGTSRQPCSLFNVALKLSDWLLVIPVKGGRFSKVPKQSY